MSSSLAGILRWAANVLSALILFFFLVMFGAGLGAQAPQVTPKEMLIFALIGLQIAGLLIAFRWALPGALVILAAHLAHIGFAPRAITNPYFSAPAVVALLRLAGGWLDRQRTPILASRARSRRPAVAIWSLVAVFLGLVSSEIGISPPLMAPRAIAVPAGLAGEWRGPARVMNTWVQRRTLPVVLRVGPDGLAQGTIGDARFLRGRLLPNQSWLGRALHLQTAYMFRGEIEGPVVAAEGITCDPPATIVFDLEGGRLSGALHLVCTGAAIRSRAPMTMFFDLDRLQATAPWPGVAPRRP